MLPITIDQFEPFPALKKVRKTPKNGNTKSFFFMSMLHHIRFDYKRLTSHWKHSAGTFYSCDLLTRFCFLRLRLFYNDGSRICWVALWFVRRCEKMARWMVRSKRGRLLLAWYSQIIRKLSKTYNKRWGIF